MVSGIKEVYSGSQEYRGGSHSLSAREVRMFRQSSQGRQPELNLEGCVVVQAEEAGNDIPGRKSSRCKSMEAEKASGASENTCECCMAGTCADMREGRGCRAQGDGKTDSGDGEEGTLKVLAGRNVSMSWSGEGKRRLRKGRDVEGVSRFPS